jgi:hypothetical protein
MQYGMLWLDTDSHRTLEEKVRRAAAYYADKYGQPPQLCLVNKTMLEEEKDVDTVHVRPVANMVKHHFLLGLELS